MAARALGRGLRKGSNTAAGAMAARGALARSQGVAGQPPALAGAVGAPRSVNSPLRAVNIDATTSHTRDVATPRPRRKTGRGCRGRAGDCRMDGRTDHRRPDGDPR